MYTKKKSIFQIISADFQRHKWKYLIIIPVIVYFILFDYKPMYGVIIAFKRYSASKGVMDSPWVGLKQFERFLGDPYFWKTLLPNTLTISILDVIFSFPVPILLALLLNEVKVPWFKKIIQTLTYLPHFIAAVVMCGLIATYCQTNGLFNDIAVFFGARRSNLLADSDNYYFIYTASDIWKSAGWGSILYLSALAGIDQDQYEAARIDGAGRFKQLIYITLPGLSSMIIMKLIMRVGHLLKGGGQKTLLLYQPLTYDVADVISSYVYRKGMVDGDYSFSTAVGMFNSVINIILLVSANKVAKKAGDSGIF